MPRSSNQCFAASQEPYQVSAAIVPVVLRFVQVRDGRLQVTPRRLAEVRGQPHQLQATQLLRADLPEVRREQQQLLLLIELTVGGESAQVEEAVAAAGELPVDDPHAVAVIDEVGRQQVV